MNYLSDSIDIHVHADPSFFERKYDAFQLAKAYRDSGVGGFVLKSHFGNTSPVVELVKSQIAEIDIYPSLTLNSFVGGFNPTAVEHAISSEVPIIWFPTFSAKNFPVDQSERNFPFSNQSLSIFNSGNQIRDEVYEILEIINDESTHVTLGNGHLSRNESFSILEIIEDQGYDFTYLITHADFDFMDLSIEDQVEMAERGVIIEKCYLPLLIENTTIEEMVESIDVIGPENCVLSTDHGQANNNPPPTAYKTFIIELLDSEISETAIKTMAVDNPRQLVEG